MPERSDEVRAQQSDEVPASARRFRVDLDGREVALSQVRGLVALRQAPSPDQSMPRVVLRRAVTGDRTLFDWSEREHPGREAHVVVELLDEAGEPVATWVLVGARAVRWSGPELDAVAGELAYEELEVGYDRLEWRRARQVGAPPRTPLSDDPRTDRSRP